MATTLFPAIKTAFDLQNGFPGKSFPSLQRPWAKFNRLGLGLTDSLSEYDNDFFHKTARFLNDFFRKIIDEIMDIGELEAVV